MKLFFTRLVILLPIITVYKSPIPGIDLGTFIFMGFAILTLFNNNAILRLRKYLILFLLYSIISTFISISLQGELFNVLISLRLGKFVFLITVVLLICHEKMFDFKYGIEFLRKITLVASFYLFAQYAAYNLFNILLPNSILSLITSESYMNNDYEALARVLYRPSSFFIEPAFLAQYLFVYLCYSIFGVSNSAKVFQFKESIIITLAIILSGSGQGILITFALWVMFFLKSVFISKSTFKRKIWLLIIIGGILIILPYIGQIDIIEKSLERVFTDNIKGGGNAFSARMAGYEYYNYLPIFYKIIGRGYGNVPLNIYFNSAAYTLYTGGALGAIFSLLIFINAFKISKHFRRILVLVYLATVIGAGTFTAAFISFYLSIIYTNNYNSTDLENIK